MQPPKKAIGFLRWFCREDYLDEIEGDLTELFQKEHPRSARLARFNFSWRVLKYFRPGFIRSFNPSTHSTGMYNNYFKIAWRNLIHNKSFSSLNIIGLSIGMTCCLILFQYVAFESGFDNFHERKENLYRVLSAYAQGDDPMTLGHAYTPQAMAPSLKAAVPEIVNISRVHEENAIVFNPDTPEKVFEEDQGLYVDEAFMKMFTFPLVSGTLKLAPGTVLISEATARKYFGNTPAEGRTLDVTGNIEKTYTVAGVFKNVPANSHLQFTMLLPVEDLLKGPDYSTEPEGGWSWNNFTTYVELHPQADREAVRQKITDVMLKYRADALKQRGGKSVLNLQPLSDIHLNSEIEAAGTIVSGSYKTLYFFLII
ncbi:MAG TPA: ABC transporter permease, partial [Cyclobacteriaceae bacterium]|nr:ABC transporter permease [Cyclobacteriaceae bacterium]